MHTLLAVDGDSLAHRAFHAYGSRARFVPARGPVYGFLALLAAVIDQVPADRLLVGFDARETSVRKDRYPAYKANRPDKSPELDALIHALPGGLEDLGVNVVQHDGWEADDVLASAAVAAEAVGWGCVVATSDRDAFALITDRTTVLRLRSGIDNAVEVTPKRLRREVGVAPEQYLDFAALRGDVSDNLPGIPGVGPARARALLRLYPSVAAAVADPLGCRSVLGPVLGQALINDLAEPATSVFLRNRELMALRTDLPVDLDACRRQVTAEHVTARLQSWGISGLAGRLATALAVRPY